MAIESKLQPTFLQNRNKSNTVTAIGNQADSRFDLEQTIDNLRQSSPLLADQIDAMIADRPNINANDNKYWLFVHSQLSYTQKFEQSGKDYDYFAPPRPSNSITINVDDLKKIRDESKQFIRENITDIIDELENQSRSPLPSGR